MGWRDTIQAVPSASRGGWKNTIEDDRGLLTRITDKIDSYTGVPTREAISSLIETKSPLAAGRAFRDSFGESPSEAITAHDLRKKAGIPDYSIKEVIDAPQALAQELWAKGADVVSPELGSKIRSIPKVPSVTDVIPKAIGDISASDAAVGLGADWSNAIPVGLLGKAVGKIPGAARTEKAIAAAIGKGGQKLARGAEKLAENATGATAVQAEKFSDNAGRELLDRGLVSWGDTPGKIAKKSESEIAKSTGVLDDSLKKLDASGPSGIRREDIVSDIDKEIAALKSDPSQADVVKKLERIKGDIAAGPEELGFAQAERTKRGYQGKSNYNKPITTQASKKTARIYQKKVEDAAVLRNPEIAKEFTDAKKSYGLLAPVLEASTRRAEQLKQSPIGGLLDTASVVGGIASGNPEEGIGLALARRFGAPRLGSTGAKSLDTASKGLLALEKKVPGTLKSLGISADVLGRGLINMDRANRK